MTIWHVMLFTLAPQTWAEEGIVVASDVAMGDSFGCDVTLWRDTAAVGAKVADVSGVAGAGAVYVFVCTGTVSE